MSFIYNSQKWRSAGMIKVFILAKAMKMVKDDNSSLDKNLTFLSYKKFCGAEISNIIWRRFEFE